MKNILIFLSLLMGCFAFGACNKQQKPSLAAEEKGCGCCSDCTTTNNTESCGCCSECGNGHSDDDTP